MLISSEFTDESRRFGELVEQYFADPALFRAWLVGLEPDEVLGEVGGINSPIICYLLDHEELHELLGDEWYYYDTGDDICAHRMSVTMNLDVLVPLPAWAQWFLLILDQTFDAGHRTTVIEALAILDATQDKTEDPTDEERGLDNDEEEISDPQRDWEIASIWDRY